MGDELDYRDLVMRTLKGDDQAYQGLYDATIREVYRNVHFLMEHKADVDDVVQEVYIQVYKSLKKYDQSKAFKPWVIGIAVKQVQSYRRKRWMSLRIVKKAESLSLDASEDFTTELIERLSNKKVLELIEQLPFKLKQVVILHYLNDYKQNEVAEILNIPVGTVKSRINAALEKMRKKGKHDPIYFEKARNVL